MIPVSMLFLLCLLLVKVSVQINGCPPGCLTCGEGGYHCASCGRGFYSVRDGAYSHCRECPTGCAVCSDPRYYPRNYCAECKDGYYGNTCGLSCSSGCYMNKCNPNNGTCYQNKCKPNFDGIYCDQCSKGQFGSDCKSMCPTNCFSCSSEVTCDKCKDRFWGAACQHNCSRGCLGGICLKKSGVCQHKKCRSGFVGEKCDRCASGRHGLNCNIK